LDRKKVSKTLAYLLRHDPSGLDISEEGWADLDILLDELKDRWSEIEADDIEKVVDEDPKGRYEIKDCKVRARYGHSIDVDPTLESVSVETLYHGTTPEAADKILEEGLKSKNRQKVHLSSSVEDARSVGKRRASSPVILEVDADEATDEGIRIGRASDRVYVTDEVPPRFISKLE